jgi:serralysin
VDLRPLSARRLATLCIFEGHQLKDVKVFNGNGRSLPDTVRLSGAAADLRDKTFIDFDKIYLHTDNTVISANSWAVASLIDGRFAQNDSLVVSGFTLSDAQRATLHSRGIEIIENAGVVSRDSAPTFSGLAGDRVISSAGSRVHIDKDGNGVISDDGGIIRSIVITKDDPSGWGYIRLAKTSRVSYTGTDFAGSIYVDDVLAGTYDTSGSYDLKFTLNSTTTTDRASAVLQAIVYWNTRSGYLSHSTAKVTISATDDGNRTSSVTVDVENANDAPAEIQFGQPTVREGAANGTFVGTIHGGDYNSGDRLTYTLVEDAGGRFAIYGSGGTVVVKNGAAIDFEAARSHTITIRATDLGGLWIERTFTINVGDVVSENASGKPGEQIVGSSRKDTLSGSDGDDLISGKGGNDVLTGGAGKDNFIFDTKLGSAKTDRKVNFDTITDFDPLDDTIHLDNAVFKKLGKSGKLNAKFFVKGMKAKDNNDYLIYNTKTGVLSYDVDGSGIKHAVEFARLTKGLKLLPADFFIV